MNSIPPYTFAILNDDAKNYFFMNHKNNLDEEVLKKLFISCCEAWDMSVSELVSNMKVRKTEYTNVRFLFCFLVKKKKLASSKRVAKFLSQNHTSCLNGVKKYQNFLDTDFKNEFSQALEKAEWNYQKRQLIKMY
jgi:hypothetical protein